MLQYLAPVLLRRCTTPLGSPNPVVQFQASNRADVVNFVLNTSYLISQVRFQLLEPVYLLSFLFDLLKPLLPPEAVRPLQRPPLRPGCHRRLQILQL